MTAEYVHIGIPILNKKEGMTYNEDMKLRVSNVDDYDFKIEYLKSEGGTSFPGTFSKQPHVTHRVDDLDHCASQAQRVISRPADCGLGVRPAFIIWDDTIVELYEEK